jgi:hypothetical protein
MSKYNTISNFLFNNTTPVLLPVVWVPRGIYLFLYCHWLKPSWKEWKTKGALERWQSQLSAPIVPVPKKNGQVRICVDLKKLNEAVKRERYVLPSLDDIAPSLHGSEVFSKLDAASECRSWHFPKIDDWSTSGETWYQSHYGWHFGVWEIGWGTWL